MRAERAMTLAVAAAFATIPAAPAPAATADLAITGLSGVPAELSPGDAATLRGTIRRTRATAKVAAITVSLRTVRGDAGAKLVGATRVRRVTGRRTAFRVTIGVPTRGFAGIQTPTRYDLVVCARSAATRKAACRRAGRVLVRPRGRGGAAAPTAGQSAPGAPIGSVAPASPGTTPTPTTSAAPAQTTPVPPSTTPTTTTRTFTPGARTLGDRLFPQLGNGGYDAVTYELALSYTPGVHQLAGTTTMTARATQDLSELSMDFQGFTVSDLEVDGVAAASTTREGTKLVITPRTGIPDGTVFRVAVTYSGQPPVVEDPDGSSEGFLQTADGAFVVNEPMGSQGWFPNNNHPTDKALFDYRITVPRGVTVMGNGRLVEQLAGTGTTTWHWTTAEPMSTYLTTVTLGAFDLTTTALPDGTPNYRAVDPTLLIPVIADGVTELLPDIHALFETTFGAYPFDSTGSIVDFAPTVGYALETQTKPNYPLQPDEGTFAHELAHQWFGNSLSPAAWEHIWLNEGFAEFTSWFWTERQGGATTAQQFATHYADTSLGYDVAPASPADGSKIFDYDAMYVRGAMTLAKLREIVGDPRFFELLRTWATTHRHGNVATPQFTALAEEVTGYELSAFFQDWLYEADRPTTLTAAPKG